jgi:hypothetical protein
MTERQVELVRDGTFFDPHFGTGCRKVSTGRVVELSPEDLEHLIGADGAPSPKDRAGARRSQAHGFAEDEAYRSTIHVGPGLMRQVPYGEKTIQGKDVGAALWTVRQGREADPDGMLRQLGLR